MAAWAPRVVSSAVRMVITISPMRFKVFLVESFMVFLGFKVLRFLGLKRFRRFKEV